MSLVLSPTKKYYGFGDENDYCVLDGGRVIGRIFRQPQAPEGRPWFCLIPDLVRVRTRSFDLDNCLARLFWPS